MVLCEENMVSKKSKIFCSVKVSRLEIVSLLITDQLQQDFYKLSCAEQSIIKLDWKSTWTMLLNIPKFLSSYSCV